MSERLLACKATDPSRVVQMVSLVTNVVYITEMLCKFFLFFVCINAIGLLPLFCLMMSACWMC